MSPSQLGGGRRSARGPPTRIRPFTLSPLAPDAPPTRRFDRFSRAAEEWSISRVYIGIHFLPDSEAGTAQGRRVGDLAVRELFAARQGRPAGSR